MNAIGDDLGVSERHLRRVFRDAVGVRAQHAETR
ncbi:hypothetical protein SCE1572_13000 [Sorangium cellulosum So0157-2]|uniref:Uncharacterized protein n=1 Tax=Sorangium cellulosum So0157-2 TaxID=1254432 RepID=S4XXL5_SORCE|nr:hypothetical protein SCE1572_13000 [Sorangium cellulosum So0157-2]